MERVERFVMERTRSAFMWTRMLRTPLWAIYGMLPFILYKDLQASPFQLAVAFGLQPAVSLFSLYWSAEIRDRPDRLRANIIWASVLGLIPFFLFPIVDQVWFFIASYGLFMMMHRGVIPAWMEILKRNIPGESRERIFAYGSAFGYLGDAIFPILIGWVLDGYVEAWRWVFPLTALVALGAVIFQYFIPIKLTSEIEEKESLPLKKRVVEPWKRMWELLQKRPDFGKFQLGFMLGGAGLMIMKPALPLFFVGVLQMSYTELAIALALCKGLGFALASPLWAQWISRVNIYRFSSLVTALAFLFPLCLIAGQFHLAWVYLAYVGYGVMQAGSELCWNMSGPIFAREEDSSVYSSVNVMTVGLRGCVAPALGSLLCAQSGSVDVLLVGAGLCLLATASGLFFSRQRVTVFDSSAN